MQVTRGCDDTERVAITTHKTDVDKQTNKHIVQLHNQSKQRDSASNHFKTTVPDSLTAFLEI